MKLFVSQCFMESSEISFIMRDIILKSMDRCRNKSIKFRIFGYTFIFSYPFFHTYVSHLLPDTCGIEYANPNVKKAEAMLSKV